MDYGLVKETPKNLNKGDYYMMTHFDVARTGQKRQYYTLYRDFTACLSGYWYNHKYQYKKNLSHDKESAMLEAKKLSGGQDVDFYESPKAEVIKFEAFNLTWKQGRKAMYAKPDFNFWAEWKKNKTEIKTAGFWVSKGIDGFMLFFKPQNN